MSDLDSRISQLQQTALFGALSDETVRLVLEQATRVERKPGDYFFREGDRSASLFWLERGAVAIVQHRDGAERELRRLGAGECFGEIASLDFGPRSASVLALEDCVALEIASRVLLRIGQRDPEQLTLLTMNVGRELSRRLRSS